jgi:hypothetical protein
MGKIWGFGILGKKKKKWGNKGEWGPAVGVGGGERPTMVQWWWGK